jgi:membrane-associated phospholipid phosphatase
MVLFYYYLQFYFQARIRDCSGTRSLACFLIRPLLQGLTILAAWFTLVSRVMDHMHHWRDVTAGGLIGTVAALLIVGATKKKHRE